MMVEYAFKFFCLLDFSWLIISLRKLKMLKLSIQKYFVAYSSSVLCLHSSFLILIALRRRLKFRLCDYGHLAWWPDIHTLMFEKLHFDITLPPYTLILSISGPTRRTLFMHIAQELSLYQHLTISICAFILHFELTGWFEPFFFKSHHIWLTVKQIFTNQFTM